MALCDAFRPFLAPPLLARSLWRLSQVPLPVRTHVFGRLLSSLGSKSGLAKGRQFSGPRPGVRSYRTAAGLVPRRGGDVAATGAVRPIQRCRLHPRLILKYSTHQAAASRLYARCCQFHRINRNCSFAVVTAGTTPDAVTGGHCCSSMQH